jgi:hypothetical protein
MPAYFLKVQDAIFFGGELFVDLDDVHGYLLLGHKKYAPGIVQCQAKSSTLN